ncbi:MAG TPA: phosphatidate cytidylyltransferase [Casimicrobiaceae bacterium]|nr:phosphatidate cytidylyltransferase [Casimicrobiaceae bacterium]
MALSSLGQRVATAVVLVPLVLAALMFLPPLGWALLTLAVVAAAAFEWAHLARVGRSAAIGFVLAVIATGLFLLFANALHFSQGWPDPVVFAICGVAALFWIVIAPAWLARQWATSSPFAMLVIGGVVLVATWVAIVDLQAHSPWLVLAAMATVWIADTAAYFTGRRLGKRKLAPTISPNKSWEGVWGGLAAVALYALVLVPLASAAGYAGSRHALALATFIAFAVGLGAISVVGDLYESLLKRHAGVKDSGSLLPGHGGVLDRIDALLAAMPLAALAAAVVLDKA